MYETRPLDLSPAGLAECAALIREVMPRGAHISEDFLDWEYNRNPDGRAFGLNAYDDGRLVSHCAVQPLSAELFGAPVRGVLSLNAVSHTSHRRKGVYFELARRTYERARDDGYAFGIAVTNDFSTAGFVHEVGFRLVSPLQARLGLGRVARRRGAAALDLAKTWRPESVAWRMAAPGSRYRTVAGPEAVSIRGPAPGLPVEVLLAELEADLCPDGSAVGSGIHSPLRLWVGLDGQVDWSRSAYVNLPMKLRPSPLNLIFVDLTGAERRLDPARVRWRALDFDTF